ncbi:MAG: hypothetical protein GX637_05675 [Clostridiales bacterium]|nr:hypothetical protein [Clostridiales bacterium]
MVLYLLRGFRQKEKSLVSGFFFFYASLFTLYFSLRLLPRLFSVKGKEEREKRFCFAKRLYKVWIYNKYGKRGAMNNPLHGKSFEAATQIVLSFEKLARQRNAKPGKNSQAE